MRSVRIETPSRLHFGLIDLNGSLGRIDGSSGLALDRPRFVLTAEKADELTVHGADAYRSRIESIHATLRSRWPLGGAELTFSETIPAHSGLGSGTQLTLALIHALTALYDVSISQEDAVALSARGGASGIGVYAFYKGGFLVDGGHKFPDRKKAFAPSSASPDVGPGPLLLRHDFPNWEILLVMPNGSHISGREELELFQSLCPMPAGAAMYVCHELIMRLLPAIAEKDLRAFASSLDSMQEVGWKKAELDAQEPVARKTMSFLRDHGALGVAMSSWGPTIVAFAEDLVALQEAADGFLASLPGGGSTLVTRANNVGMRLVTDGSTGPDTPTT